MTIIDEPFRTRAISQLRLILKFRKGHYPPTNVPLELPPLAHDLAGGSAAHSSFHCAARTGEFSTVTSSIGQDGRDQGSCTVSDSIQLSNLSEVLGTRQATGMCMQDLVLIGHRTLVCTCWTDSTCFSVGRRFEPEWHHGPVRQAMDTYCWQGITHVVQQVETT